MIQFGSLALASNLFLSPLAGYTNLPFRLVAREIGGLHLATTDLVNARSLIERNPKAFKLIETNEQDRPLAVQLFGSVPEEMRDAAVMLQELGVSAIDINMGCPVRKICRVGGGSAMMTDHSATQHLVRTMIKALRIPVTAKMRLGWDDDNLTAPDLVRSLEDAGIAGIFIHGRTREQGFSGTVNLSGIRSVVAAARSIPVIGNGDVTTPEAAKMMFNETGCHGVSIGRGAFYDPWIFVRTQAYLATGILPPEPSIADRVRVMSRHLDLMIDVFGERHGCVMFRKIGPWYAKRFGPSSDFSKKIVRLESHADYEEIVESYLRWRTQFCDDSGNLLPRYALTPMMASFMRAPDEPASIRRESIPVPQGPVEVW